MALRKIVAVSPQATKGIISRSCRDRRRPMSGGFAVSSFVCAVIRVRCRSPVTCKSSPGNWVAPAGSGRSDAWRRRNRRSLRG